MLDQLSPHPNDEYEYYQSNQNGMSRRVIGVLPIALAEIKRLPRESYSLMSVPSKEKLETFVYDTQVGEISYNVIDNTGLYSSLLIDFKTGNGKKIEVEQLPAAEVDAVSNYIRLAKGEFYSSYFSQLDHGKLVLLRFAEPSGQQSRAGYISSDFEAEFIELTFERKLSSELINSIECERSLPMNVTAR
ncbi:hypothetical protein [Parvularcula sp. IMCC14364]|uniref:hypothetical protein n=1 Tax=Parvularcula sp. IMCC14364 TaxID=3067902 RepID=UPI00274100D2|nr:hypothetical protein [Parvularcula sp. IMCC14364]